MYRVGPSPIDARRAPTEQPARKLEAPADLRVGDAVYAFRWDWKQGTILRIYRAGVHKGEPTPRTALVKLENGSAIKRPCEELIPVAFVEGENAPHDPHSRDAARVRAARAWESVRKTT